MAELSDEDKKLRTAIESLDGSEAILFLVTWHRNKLYCKVAIRVWLWRSSRWHVVSVGRWQPWF